MAATDEFVTKIPRRVQPCPNRQWTNHRKLRLLRPAGTCQLEVGMLELSTVFTKGAL